MDESSGVIDCISYKHYYDFRRIYINKLNQYA